MGNESIGGGDVIKPLLPKDKSLFIIFLLLLD